MSTLVELNSIFDTAEELVGTYPSSDGLRNAIHAVITKGIAMDERVSFFYRKIESSVIMDNVEYLARNYESLRGVHMHLGRGCYQMQCNNPDNSASNGWEGNNDPIERVIK